MATVMAKPRKGFPLDLLKTKLKNKGDSVVYTNDRKMLAFRVLDRKHVTILSTKHGTEDVKTGAVHFETKQPVTRPKVMHMYNQYMGEWM